MTRRIDQDRKRYLDIVRGKVREELKKAMKRGEILGKRDGKIVKVPIPHIDMPRIRHGSRQSGVGQGEGDEGDVISDGEQDGDPRKAGDQPGDHSYEHFTLEEIANQLADDLELPNIKPKGKKMIYTTTDKLKTISKIGPRGRMHKKRSFKNALKRSMAASGGKFDPYKLISPIRPDRRYRQFKDEFIPEMNAVIFYMMDISGSMGQEQKETVGLMNFWIDLWLSHQYKGVESRYIVHDTIAREVPRDDFYHLSAGGGTMISSAFLECSKILNRDYDPNEWNVYVFYSSDGDNWSKTDSENTFKCMDNEILPYSNMVGYTQVKSRWGSGDFMKHLNEYYNFDDENLGIIATEVESKDDIMRGIKDLLGKGK